MDTKNLLEQDMSVPAKLAIGAAGVGVGLIDQIVSWAQIVSVIGGAIIVIITLVSMIYRTANKLLRKH